MPMETVRRCTVCERLPVKRDGLHDCKAGTTSARVQLLLQQLAGQVPLGLLDDVVKLPLHMDVILGLVNFLRLRRWEDCYEFETIRRRDLLQRDGTFTLFGSAAYRGPAGACKMKRGTRAFVSDLLGEENMAVGDQLLLSLFVKRAKTINKVFVIGDPCCPHNAGIWVDVRMSADPAIGRRLRNGVVVSPEPGSGICATCMRTTHRRCGGCRSVFYCCAECQKQHWKSHKDVCSIVTQIDSEATVPEESAPLQ